MLQRCFSMNTSARLEKLKQASDQAIPEKKTVTVLFVSLLQIRQEKRREEYLLTIYPLSYREEELCPNV